MIEIGGQIGYNFRNTVPWEVDTSMADIINLNKVRKSREKAARESQAKQNRVSFGQKKAEKKVIRDDVLKKSKELDDRKLD